MDVVIVTAYWRPNYIAKCLECLQTCRGDRQVWVFQDSRISLPPSRYEGYIQTQKTILSNIGMWDKFVQRPPHSFDMTGADDHTHPCSYNTFWALREAYESGAEYIYFVADDVLVTPDFFRWHEAVQNDGAYFSTVAERAFRQFVPDPKPFDLSAYYEAPTNLMDGGACWKRQNLGLLLDYPSLTIRDHRFYGNQKPMIPYVQRAYHVGRLSSAVYNDAFNVCGDTDDIPTSMPVYEWNHVYRVEEKACQ